MPAKGWKDILLRTKAEIKADNLSLVAGGVAFYAFLAAAPALAATIAIYALVADASTVVDHLQLLRNVVPADVMPLLQQQASNFVNDDAKASWGLAVGLALALFGSTKVARSLILGLNIAYDESERRGFVRLNLLAFGLTGAGIISAVIVFALLAAAPVVLRQLAISTDTERLLSWGRWPLMFLGFTAALSVVYWVGPSRQNAKWRWVTWGALVATTLWIIASVGFSIYASHFGNYGKSYGALASVVVFMLWLYITAYVVLFGAELNAEMEHQTVEDTTQGAPKPMGERGAYVADTVGKTAAQVKKKSKKKKAKETLEPGTDRDDTKPKRSSKHR
tara:strand:- start:381 stop:1385 length:1005 start_codon:yes stop_codon:yes gene_type:complete